MNGGEGFIRVLLVDDHPLVRDGVRMRLEATGHIRVAGEAGIATEPGAAPEDSVTALLAAGSSAFGAVASIPTIAGLVFASATLPFAAAPGIGLGSIAGLDSVCASASAVAASAAGAGDVANAGLCIQPKS